MNNTQPLVSVIVPIYNVEKYLAKCLNSLINQTLKNIEIICIDDCSTDNSVNIATSFKEKDNRICIISHSQNKGLAAARNTGLKNAKAQYIMCCDSDDFYSLDMCKKLYDGITMSGADFATSGINVIYESMHEYKESDESYYSVKYNGLVSLTSDMLSKIDASSCNKIFRRELIEKYNILYPEGFCYEDACFFFKYFSISTNAFFVNEKLYNYVRHSNSIMSETFRWNEKAIDHIKIMDFVYDYLVNNNLWEKYKEEFFKNYFLYLSFSHRYSLDGYKEKVFDYAINFLKRFDEKVFEGLSIDTANKINNILNRRLKGNLKNLTFLEKIFSIRNEYIGAKKYKSIILFGNSIKIRKKNMQRRVCFCLDQCIMGGVEKIVMVLLPELKKHYDISLIVESKIKDPYFIEFFKEQEIPVYCTNNKKPKSFFKRKYWKLWGRKFNSNRLKHLFSNMDLIIDYKNLWAVNYLKNIKIPKIAVFHGSFTAFEKWNIINRVDLYDKMICLTQNFREDFIAKYPHLSSKIEHIYNPFDFELMRKKSNNTSIQSKQKYFIAVQRLFEDKDVATVIKAFQIFSQRHSDIYLYIVGDGPDKEKLEILANNHPRIVFTGQVDNPYGLIKGAEALILSSTKEIGEGLPVTLIEAQALETLAISSDVKSGPAEILIYGKAGILFPVGDEKALAQIMEDVIKGAINKGTLIKTACENLNRFEKEKIISVFLRVVKNVLALKE